MSARNCSSCWRNLRALEIFLEDEGCLICFHFVYEFQAFKFPILVSPVTNSWILAVSKGSPEPWTFNWYDDMIWPSYTQIQAKLGRGPCGNPCWLSVLQSSLESLVACFADQDLLHDFAMLCSPFVVAEHWLQTLAQQISQRQHVFSQTTANYKPMDLKWYLHHLLQIEVDLHSFLPSCPAYLYSLSRPSAFSLRFVQLGWKCAGVLWTAERIVERILI